MQDHSLRLQVRLGHLSWEDSNREQSNPALELPRTCLAHAETRWPPRRRLRCAPGQRIRRETAFRRLDRGRPDCRPQAESQWYFSWLYRFLGIGLCCRGRVNLKVEPPPSCDVTHILPPFCSMILRQMAKPIPLPGYSVRVCSRLNMTKISWQYSGAMPMPLSATENSHSFSCLS